MEKNPIILDITSSDDEVGFDDSSTADNFDWISNLLEHSPHDDVIFDYSKGVLPTDDDDDDVVVVGEVFAKPKRKKVSLNDSRCLGFDDVVDDDCVVLNCDPEKPPEKETVTEGDGKGSDLDSDDLLIIGEKGQVACRDYPHSRHLCAKFPFDSTLHGSHCDLCHCYVCDTLAPCAFWGSGVSNLDHCSATDKSGYWQTERKRIRQLKNPSVPLAKPVANSLFRLQTSSQPTAVLSPASTGGVPSSFGLPNIISQGRNPRANIALQRKRFRSPEIVGQLLRSCNSNTQSLRTSNFTPSLVSSRALFKRPGFTGRTRMVNPSVCVPRNNASSVSYWQQLLNHPLVAEPTENNSTNLTKSSSRLDINISSSLPLASNVSSGTLPSPMQGYNSPLSITPTSRFQGYHQSNGLRSDSPWVYSSGSRTQNGYSPGFHSSTYNVPNSVTQSGQQSSVFIQNGSVPNLPPCNTSDLLRSVTLSIPQTSEATQNIYSSDFLCNTSDSTEGIVAQRYEQQHSIEKPQVEGAAPGDVFLSLLDHNDKEISGAMDSSALDFDLDGWLTENDPILDAQNGSGLYQMDDQPSPPPALDAGMLYFDFDTSWEGLAHS